MLREGTRRLEPLSSLSSFPRAHTRNPPLGCHQVPPCRSGGWRAVGAEVQRGAVMVQGHTTSEQYGHSGTWKVGLLEVSELLGLAESS